MILIVTITPVFAVLKKESWYMNPASANQASYNCALIDNSANRESFNCNTGSCIMDEGATYWICTEDKPGSCDDNGSLGECFYQQEYSGTPPPTIQLLDMIWDGTYVKAQILVGQVKQDNLVVKVVYDRWPAFGSISSAFDPIGFLTIKDVLFEKHSCNEIGMSKTSGCKSITVNDNINGWHWIDYTSGIGDGAGILGGLITVDNSLWGGEIVSVGDLVNPSVKLDDSAYFNVSYFNQTSDLKVDGVINNSVTGKVVLDDDVNIAGGLKVTGLATLGKVPFLRNSYEPITLNDTTNFDDLLDTDDLIAFTAQITDLTTKDFELDVDMNVRQDFVSDAHIKAERLMGAVALGSNCIKENGDGGLSMAFGCN